MIVSDPGRWSLSFLGRPPGHARHPGHVAPGDCFPRHHPQRVLSPVFVTAASNLFVFPFCAW